MPYENVLRASGGNWQQNFSIRVETVTGNRNDLVNRSIRHTASGVIFTTPVLRTKNLTSTLTELFLDANFLSSSYTVGDTIEVYEGSTLIFSGTISPTTTTLRISQAGTGFKVGQIFNITAGGIDTLIKVTEVSSVGGIVKAKIISYGYGYAGVGGTNTLTVVLDKDSNITSRENFFTSKVSGFGSSGQILKSDPLSPNRYFDTDYTDDPFFTVTEISATFNNDSFNPIADTEGSGDTPVNLAVIVFTLGALAAYPGSYFNDQSFISEFVVRLQDGQLYQPFAYQTNTEIDILLFVDVVKKLINPAGQALFNNRLLQQDVNLSAGLELDITRKILLGVHDSLTYSDSTAYEKYTAKDSIALFDSDEFITLSKDVTDSNDTSFATDNNSIQTEKEFDDTVSTSDSVIAGLLVFRTFEENRAKDYFLENYTDEGDYVEQSGVVFTDDQTINLNSGASDAAAATDVFSLQKSTSFDDTTAISDEPLSSFEAIREELVEITQNSEKQILQNPESITTANTLFELGVFVQDYFGEDYILSSEPFYVLTELGSRTV